MGLSIWQVLLVIVLLLLLFGRGKIPQLMGDIAEGIKSFREGMGKPSSEADQHSLHEAAQLPEPQPRAAQPSSTTVQTADRA